MTRFYRYFATAAALLTSVSASPIAATGASQAGPTVTIASGVVVGFATEVVSASTSTASAYNYLGIPFAQPPTGTLRFAPPATPTAWSTPLQATQLPPACYEQFNAPTADFIEAIFANPGGPTLQQSEDCLYLNVYAPTDASTTNKKAVLFWIYGGDLQFGSGSLITYNGSSFAGFQDVVVVTFNYRTNIFGFSNSPQIPVGQQNSGYLDQRLALQWVQDNIAQFGGDPDQVTIFGESAGGWSVKQLLAQPPSPLPFRAAILESEATMFTGSALASYNQVLSNFGCASSPAPLTCIQQVNASSIITYISTNALSFAPANDHVTSTTDVRPNILSKQWAPVPFFLGTNANEGRVFAAAAGLDQSNLPITSGEVIATLLPNLTDFQNASLQVYSSLVNNTYLFASQVITDLEFTCPASSLSSFAAANGFDVWRYYYNASFPNESPFTDAGAYHSSEIPQVWGTYGSFGGATATQEGLSAYMQKTWAEFAKSPAEGPAVGQGWPRLGSTGTGRELWQLGGPGAPEGGELIDLSVADYGCVVFDPIVAFEGF
ncbi:alpha/beta-hydrolase [Mollisia scopiformis]|uniref:Carboxylic ester hydrolase n=1 Tax=Mollisia scopiformis TaxID=149040 RepID=A0A194X1Y8_MOLSC|nr:alpha/beta-hydrolase [Mollisia scopiformis]KUJ13852.1 alpha/beta-hydrolase [Mollisia scopiformis]